ncbi:MAG: hypothetical protein BUE48_001925 [Thermomonospora sp. CIF 1]|nr:MAG: hypothetical protein BUE48_001925 [Thermomonospora sp. CIF 1]
MHCFRVVGASRSVVRPCSSPAPRDAPVVVLFHGGGAATNVMPAAYPDVFAAGAVFFGMPYGRADTEEDHFTTGAFGPCSGSYFTVPPRQWGGPHPPGPPRP